MISLFVDDLVIMSASKILMDDTKLLLKQKWSMKDLGDLKSILGMTVERSGRTLKLSQPLFIKNLLAKYFRGSARQVATPLDPGTKLSKDSPTYLNSEKDNNSFPYREIIGALNYLSQCTRPDLTYAVSQLSKYSNCHNTTHHNAVNHVLRYLNHTRNEGITFSSDLPLEPYGMSDATWGSDLDNSRSVSGYVFYLGGGPVAWSSKSQKTVALSSAESEYVAMCSATKEALHLKQFLPELDQELYDEHLSMTLYGDNTACIAIAKDPVMHERQKHFDIKLHFIRETLARNEVNLKYIETEINVADLMTKPSSTSMFRRCIRGLRGDFHITQLKDTLHQDI